MSLRIFAVAVVFGSGAMLACDRFRSGSAASAKGRIEIPTNVSRIEPKPITNAQIIQLREPGSPKISPNGQHIAFTVRQAFLDSNSYRTALYIVAADSSTRPHKLLEERSIGGLQWTPDGTSLSIVRSAGGTAQVWRVNPMSGAMKQITRHPTGVGSYEWSRDGNVIVFSARDTLMKSVRDSLYDYGILWRDGYEFTDVTEGTYTSKLLPGQLWIMSVEDELERKIWEHPLGPTQFSVSPDGKYVAVTYRKSYTGPYTDVNNDIDLIDVAALSTTTIIDWPRRESGVDWSPDGKSLLFMSNGDEQGDQLQAYGPQQIYAYSMDTKLTRVIGSGERAESPFWSGDGSLVVAKGSDRHNAYLVTLPATGGAPTRITGSDDHLDECSVDAQLQFAACIRENTMMAPEIAVVDLRSGIPRTLTHLNPEMRNVALGQITKLDWVNKFGDPTHGYLIKPVGYQEGKRYPLVMVFYAQRNQFVTQAQWISGAPAQRLAANGIAVLLGNYPITPVAGHHGNFAEWSRNDAWSPLASMEKAVDTLDKMGVIDPNRLGVMGLSYGSFLTDFAMTHSKLFKAAASLDGGRENISRYILEGSDYQLFDEGYFGGSPYGPAFANWKEISPALNTANVSGPVLMQYAKRIWGLEFYVAMKSLGKPVELVFYPDDDHVFDVPTHRRTSLEQNYDWFNYWLKDEIDPNPAKATQYERWKAMRPAAEKIWGQQ
jgi:dipeptidyl aminopeptidase/acylaminoacyl peptidase